MLFSPYFMTWFALLPALTVLWLNSHISWMWLSLTEMHMTYRCKTHFLSFHSFLAMAYEVVLAKIKFTWSKLDRFTTIEAFYDKAVMIYALLVWLVLQFADSVSYTV